MAGPNFPTLRRRLIAIGNVLLGLVLAGLVVPPASAVSRVTIAAAGDIACKPGGPYFDGSTQRVMRFYDEP